MAINYTLDIGSVKKKPTHGTFENVIIEASFSVFAISDEITTGSEEDGNYTVTQPAFSHTSGGYIILSTDSLEENSFIAFDSVSKDTLKGWILGSEGVSDVADFSHVKSSIEVVAREIYDFNQQVPDVISGGSDIDDLSGSSEYSYTPPAE